ncbi:MAG: transaldolase family protein [Chloroflexota bacterium]
MAIFLDSANPRDAAEAFALGFVAGVTTNPRLLASQGADPLRTIGEIAKCSSGSIFYQPMAQTATAMVEEMERAHALVGDRLVAKIPCSPGGFTAVARLRQDMTCAMTTVFSAAQVYAAACAGCRYALPYLNRMTRLGGDGAAVVERMADMVATTELELVVASIRSTEEIERAILAGAAHVTVPLVVLRELVDHPLSRQAIAEFARAARGLERRRR